MSWEPGAATRLPLAALALAAAFLGACTTTSTTSTGGQPPTAEADRGRGNASSEDGDAARRARTRLELASAYFGSGQMNTALDEVKLALAADPNMGAAYNLRGLIYGRIGEDKLAEESFRRALQIDPRDADAMQNYGWFMCQRQRFAEAETMFRQALGVPQYRDTPRTMLTQGICQARAGQLLQAEGTLTRSYELDPSNPATAVNLAEVLFRRNELERARFYIRRVNANRDLSSAQTLWLAARIEQKLGNRQGVQDFGTQLRSRFPQSREASAFEQGKFDE
jgi:type IV pilus assembly protein PilF